MSNNHASIACAVLTDHLSETLLGWIAWHFAIGIQRIAVIDTGISSSARHLITALQESWPVSIHTLDIEDNDLPENAKNKRLFATQCALTYLKGHEEWGIILDSDEYLLPDPHLDALLERIPPNASAMALNWCIYGNNDHATLTQQHVTDRYSAHALKNFYDHRLTRLIIRQKDLPSPHSLQNPLSLDIPEDKTVTSTGHPYSSDTPVPEWSGGKILHYICASQSLNDSLHHYFNRNDVITPIPENYLYHSRVIQNCLLETSLKDSTHQLHLFRQSLESDTDDLYLHEDSKIHHLTPHPTFHYLRISPSQKERDILSPFASPPYSPLETFLLKNTSTHAFLEAAPLDSKRRIIAIRQNNIPELLTLFAEDGKPFVLGDIPAPFGTAVTHITYTDTTTGTLGSETALTSEHYQLIPYTEPYLSTLTPLPKAPNKREGITLKDFFIWYQMHPHTHTQDLQRMLLLLSSHAAHELTEKIPNLRYFLPQLFLETN